MLDSASQASHVPQMPASFIAVLVLLKEIVKLNKRHLLCLFIECLKMWLDDTQGITIGWCGYCCNKHFRVTTVTIGIIFILYEGVVILEARYLWKYAFIALH